MYKIVGVYEGREGEDRFINKTYTNKGRALNMLSYIQCNNGYGFYMEKTFPGGYPYFNKGYKALVEYQKSLKSDYDFESIFNCMDKLEKLSNLQDINATKILLSM